MFDIQIKIDGLDEIEKMPEEWRSSIVRGFRDAMLMIEGKAKSRFGKAGNIKARTGHYRRSISTSVKERGNNIIGTLAGNVVYAAAHEYSMTIYPKKGKYLRFPIKGQWVTTKKVVIPKRPLLTPSVTENVNEVGNIIVNRIVKGME